MKPVHRLLDLSSIGVNRAFVLLFETNAQRAKQTGYFLVSVEIKGFNVLSSGRNCFDQLVKHNNRTS